MAATFAMRKEYLLLVEKMEQRPEYVDYGALAGMITAMRAAGTPCKRVVVKLRPERPLGQRLQAAYAAAQAMYPVLPPLEWQGRKDPDGRSSQDVYREWQKLHGTDPSQAATGNPFADKLAALRADA